MSEAMVVPDLTEPIVGWRGWRVHPSWVEPSPFGPTPSVSFDDPNGPYLGAMNDLICWPKRQALEAECHRTFCGMLVFGPEGCVEHPNSICTCGIYAYNDPKLLRHDFRGVVGQVALWGKVIRHKRGYRTQYAYPKTLRRGGCCDISDDVLRQLLDGYGCEQNERLPGQQRFDI